MHAHIQTLSIKLRSVSRGSKLSSETCSDGKTDQVTFCAVIFVNCPEIGRWPTVFRTQEEGERRREREEGFNNGRERRREREEWWNKGRK